jgi:hypothetical protein
MRWFTYLHGVNMPAIRRAAIFILLFHVYRLLAAVWRFTHIVDRTLIRTMRPTVAEASVHICQIIFLLIAIVFVSSKYYALPIGPINGLMNHCHMSLIMLTAPLLFIAAGLGFSFGAINDSVSNDGALDLLLFFVISASVQPFFSGAAINVLTAVVYCLRVESLTNLFFLIAGISMTAFAKGTEDYYAKHRFGVAALTIDEVARNEKLLKRMLPEAMVEQLLTVSSATGKPREPIAFQDVCILYCDVSGFTKLSSTLEPQVVIETVNKMFSAFEAAAARNGIFKVQTIGVRRAASLSDSATQCVCEYRC